MRDRCPAKKKSLQQNLLPELRCTLLISDGGEIQSVRVEDHSSKPCHARAQVEGVPAEGVIDTSADITIIGENLFRRVAAVARLKKKNFKEADKIPQTYD